MEDVFAAEPLFQFDLTDYNELDSNTMDNRKIVAEDKDASEKAATITPDKCQDPVDLFTPPTTITAPKILTPNIQVDDNKQPDNTSTTPNNNDNIPIANNIPIPNNTPKTDHTPNSTPNNTPSSILSSSTPSNNILLPELLPEIKIKILEQVEFYFSDANVTKDKELAKQIRRNEMGYVSIKWITSFRKIQSLTQDWKAVSRILAQSAQLKVSSDKKMVRRKHPIPKKSDQFADKTVMASNLPLSDRSVDCVKEYFKSFGKVTLVRFLTPGKPYPDDIVNLHLQNWRGNPPTDIVAVEFDTVEAAEKAVLKLSDSNNWRSSSQVQLLRTRAQKQATAERMVNGTKVRKSSEHCNLTYSLNQNCTIRENNNNGFARSLPKQMFGNIQDHGTSPTNVAQSVQSPHRRQEKSPQSYTSRSSFSRSVNAGSYSDSCSPSANSYLGQRLAMEKSTSNSPTTVPMLLTREPRGPNGTRGFGHRVVLDTVPA